MNRPYPLYDQRPEFFDLRALLAASANDYGQACAVSYRVKPTDTEKVCVSYTELERRVRALGTEFLARGLNGKHCVLIGKLSFSWILSYLALLSVGAVLVPLDPEWEEHDLAETAKKARGAFLIADIEQSAKMQTVCENCGIGSVLYTKAGLGETVEELVALGQARVENGDRSFDEVRVETEKMSLLVFTSGTTGQGKGVMLSQRNLLSNLYGAQRIAVLGKKTVGILPPHHTFGSTVGILCPICIGCELYISHGLAHFAKELQQESPDGLILVPLFLETFAAKIRTSVQKKGKEKQFDRMLSVNKALQKVGLDLSEKAFKEVLRAFGGNLKQVICGGAPMSREVYELFTALGVRVLNGYGITECSPLISVNRPKHILEGSAGMPIPNIEVKIDTPSETGEGEICVRGQSVFLGYYENEAATESVMDADGYFHTGDIGRIDEKTGYIFITGRVKNLIILSNGKNVYPEEIESSLASIPGISEVVVYEGQSARGVAFNKIVAEVCMDKEFLKKQGIADAKAYLKPFLEKYNRAAVSYKRVALLRIREEEFPKNTLRKIVRFKIDRSIE